MGTTWKKDLSQGFWGCLLPVPPDLIFGQMGGIFVVKDHICCNYSRECLPTYRQFHIFFKTSCAAEDLTMKLCVSVCLHEINVYRYIVEEINPKSPAKRKMIYGL